MDPAPLLTAGCVSQIAESPGSTLGRNTTVQVLQIAKLRVAYFLQVSDGRHSTYLQLHDTLCETVASNALRIGQLCVVESVDPGRPCPVATGLTPLTLRTGAIGTPAELRCDEFKAYAKSQSNQPSQGPQALDATPPTAAAPSSKSAKAGVLPRPSPSSPSPTARRAQRDSIGEVSEPTTPPVATPRRTTSPRGVVRRVGGSPQGRSTAAAAAATSAASAAARPKPRSSSSGKPAAMPASSLPAATRKLLRPKLAPRSAQHLAPPDPQLSTPMGSAAPAAPAASTTAAGKWQQRRARSESWQHIPDPSEADSESEELSLHQLIDVCSRGSAAGRQEAPSPGRPGPKHCPSTAGQRDGGSGVAPQQQQQQPDPPKSYRAARELHLKQKAARAGEPGAGDASGSASSCPTSPHTLDPSGSAESDALTPERGRGGVVVQTPPTGGVAEGDAELEARRRALEDEASEARRVVAEEEKRLEALRLIQAHEVEAQRQRMEEEGRERQRQAEEMQREHEARVRELAERESRQAKALEEREVAAQQRMEEAEAERMRQLAERESAVKRQMEAVREEQRIAEEQQARREEALAAEREALQRRNEDAQKSLAEQRRQVEREQEDAHLKAREEVHRLEAQAEELRREHEAAEARLQQGETAARLTQAQVEEQEARLAERRREIEEESAAAKENVLREEQRLEALRIAQGGDIESQRQRLEQEEAQREARRREETEAVQQAHDERVRSLARLEEEQMKAVARREEELEARLQAVRQEQRRAESDQSRYLEERERAMREQMEALRQEQRQAEEEHRRQGEVMRAEQAEMQRQREVEQARLEQRRREVEEEEQTLQRRAREELRELEERREAQAAELQRQRREEEAALRRQQQQTEEELRRRQQETEEGLRQQQRRQEEEIAQLCEAKEREVQRMQEEKARQLEEHEQRLAAQEVLLKAQLERSRAAEDEVVEAEDEGEEELDNRAVELSLTAAEAVCLVPNNAGTPGAAPGLPEGRGSTGGMSGRGGGGELFQPQLQPRVLQSPLAMLRQLAGGGVGGGGGGGGVPPVVPASGRVLSFDDDMSESAEEGPARVPLSRHRVSRVRGSTRSSSGSRRGGRTRTPSQCDTSACGSRSGSALVPMRDTLFDPASCASSASNLTQLRPRQPAGTHIPPGLQHIHAPWEDGTDEGSEEWGNTTLRFTVAHAVTLEKQMEELHTQMEANRSLEAAARGFQELVAKGKHRNGLLIVDSFFAFYQKVSDRLAQHSGQDPALLGGFRRLARECENWFCQYIRALFGQPERVYKLLTSLRKSGAVQDPAHVFVLVRRVQKWLQAKSNSEEYEALLSSCTRYLRGRLNEEKKGDVLVPP